MIWNIAFVVNCKGEAGSWTLITDDFYGEKYYERETGEEGTYLYSGNYFMNFIEEPQTAESKKEFKF